MKRVVITGAGTINSIGQNVSQTINSFKAGRCGISDLKFKDVERLSIKIGGQINDFEPDKHSRSIFAPRCHMTVLFSISVGSTVWGG